MTDAQGVPLAATVTAANVPEITQVFTTLDDMPPVGGKPGPKRQKPDRLQGDRGYDSEPVRQGLRGRGPRRCWRPAIRSTAAVWASPAGT